jgi:hypothetical protein
VGMIDRLGGLSYPEKRERRNCGSIEQVEQVDRNGANGPLLVQLSGIDLLDLLDLLHCSETWGRYVPRFPRCIAFDPSSILCIPVGCWAENQEQAFFIGQQPEEPDSQPGNGATSKRVRCPVHPAWSREPASSGSREGFSPPCPP